MLKQPDAQVNQLKRFQMPVSKSTRKLDLLVALAMIVLALIACSIGAPVPPEEHPTLPATRTASRPTNTPTFRPTVVASTPTRTPTRQPTPTPEATATEVTMTPPGEASVTASLLLAGYDYDHPDLSRCIEKAFWSDDEQLIYYAFASHCGKKPLRWAAYDIAARSTLTISSPLRYDPGVWRRLNVREPLRDTPGYPELLGYVSPSGKHVIYTTYSSPDLSATTEIWLADSDGRRRIKLLKTYLGMVHQAAWFKDETKLIFDFGYEGPASVYIADVRKGPTVSLEDVSDFKTGTEQPWSISPDDTTLAIMDTHLRLWLVSLEDGKGKVIEQFAKGDPCWSKDGKRLYYLWGPSYHETDALRSYDVISNSVTTLVSLSKLEDALGTSLGYYEVSSGEDKIVVWGGGLWLVELYK